MADQLLDKSKKEGELRNTLVVCFTVLYVVALIFNYLLQNCYSTIEALEGEVAARKQAAKERDELKNTVTEVLR